MIVNIQEARAYAPSNINDEVIKRKILAIERLIRDETNNNFQNPHIRFYARTRDGIILGSSPYMQPGDTIEINESVNDGIYTITAIDGDVMQVDGKLFDAPANMVTKIVYPESVQEGVLNMLQWDFNMRSKTGIKSESLSRYSVTYYDMDAANSLDGYPASLIGFLEPYYKMRF